MELLQRFLSAIAGSKKAVATIATVLFVLVTPLLAKVSVTVTEDELEKVVALVIAYLVGQGVADHGKEAAKIHQAGSTRIPKLPPKAAED